MSRPRPRMDTDQEKISLRIVLGLGKRISLISNIRSLDFDF